MEFLGFIALIAIICGISLSAAFGVAVKIIVALVLGSFAIYLYGKLLESESGRKFLIFVSVAVALWGLYILNNSQLDFSPCYGLPTDVGLSCSSTMVDVFETSQNTARIMLVGGVISALIACGSKKASE